MRQKLTKKVHMIRGYFDYFFSSLGYL